MMKTTHFHHSSISRKALLWVEILLTLTCSSAIGQTNSFDSGSTGTDGALFINGAQAPFEDFATVYDEARNELLVFGGQRYNSPHIESDQTYTFNGTNWTRKRPANSPPATDQGMAIAYDSGNEKVVLYLGRVFNQLSCWTWDGSDWSEILPPDLERPFEIFDMVYDAARSEILFVAKDYGGTELETWGFDGTTWVEKSPATSLPARNALALSYDPTLQKPILLLRVSSSETETWTWDGNDWTLIEMDPIELDLFSGSLLYDGRTNTTIFLEDYGNYSFTGSEWIPLTNVPEIFSTGIEAAIYDPGLNALLSLNGIFRTDSGGAQQRNETWAWNADDSTERLTSGFYTIDMTTKPDGVWNYTTIDIGPNVEVTFNNNEANTPLRWLASGNVTIEGTVNISGKVREEPDLFPYFKGLGGIPGPGAYPGATGGPYGSALRVPGGGPEGGLYTGVNGTQNASFKNYGNPWLFPLIGGSGAGGFGNSSSGGAGGGALMIASSDTINVLGEILAEGSTQINTNSGTGSGGAVLLRATTIKGSGTLAASRIRLEAWKRQLDDLKITPVGNNLFTAFTKGDPLLPVNLGENPSRLWVHSINGVLLPSQLLSPDTQLEADAYISGGGTVPIVIKGENIPEMAEVSVKISLQDLTILEPEAATYTGGQATINVDLPTGFGAITATAKFPVDTQ